MRRFLFLFILVLGLGLRPSEAATADHGTEAEAAALMKKAIAHDRKLGTQAFADISRNPGPFITGRRVRLPVRRLQALLGRTT